MDQGCFAEIKMDEGLGFSTKEYRKPAGERRVFGNIKKCW